MKETHRQRTLLHQDLPYQQASCPCHHAFLAMMECTIMRIMSQPEKKPWFFKFLLKKFATEIGKVVSIGCCSSIQKSITTFLLLQTKVFYKWKCTPGFNTKV